MASILKTTRESSFGALQLFCRLHGKDGNCGGLSCKVATLRWFSSSTERSLAPDTSVGMEERGPWLSFGEGLRVGRVGWRSRNWYWGENLNVWPVGRGLSSKASRPGRKRTGGKGGGRGAEEIVVQASDDSGLRESVENKTSKKSRSSTVVTRSGSSLEEWEGFDDLEGSMRGEALAEAKSLAESSQNDNVFALLTREDVEPRVDLFEELGLNPAQIGRLLIHQHVSSLSLDKRVKPVVNYLLGAGFSKEEVGSIVRRHPQVLLLTVKESIAPKFKWFKNLGLPAANVLRVIRGAPELLGCNLEKMITKKFEWLATEIGISHADALGMLVKDPKMFESNLGTLETTVDLFRSWGVDDDGMKILMTKMPSVIARNQVALAEKFSFAQSVLKKDPEQILASPRYFSSSFEKLILMRVAMLQRMGLDPASYSLNYLVRAKNSFSKQYEEEVVAAFEEEWSELSKEEMLKSINHQRSATTRKSTPRFHKKKRSAMRA